MSRGLVNQLGYALRSIRAARTQLKNCRLHPLTPEIEASLQVRLVNMADEEQQLLWLAADVSKAATQRRKSKAA